MKTPPLSFVVLILLLVAGEASARDLTTAEFRKFRGRYTGEVSGIAGDTTRPQVIIPDFATAIVVTSKPVEMPTPMIRDLFAATKHRIVWRKPTGTPNRATLIGIYNLTFTNSMGVSITARGTRRIVINDRGASAPQRYVASFSDDLKETVTLTGATSAAYDLNGILSK